MGFQEENAGTIPSEIPRKPVVYLDGTESRHKPTEHHIRKNLLACLPIFDVLITYAVSTQCLLKRAISEEL